MTIDVTEKTVTHAVDSENSKRGFTLTEVAIVLGIIGLILGAIWVAAAAVYSNLRVSKATTQLLTITQNVRALYATSGTVDAAANMTLASPQATTALTYIQSKVFPSDMINATGDTVQDPWGGFVAIDTATNATTGDSFSITFQTVPQSACVALVTSNSGTGRDPGLNGVTIKAAGGTTLPGVAPAITTLPILASVAQPLCSSTGTTAAASNNVSFFFQLK